MTIQRKSGIIIYVNKRYNKESEDNNMMEQVTKFNDNKAVLINGKCILYKVSLKNEKNRMEIARKIFNTYPNHFGTVAEVISSMRDYEKTGDFIINNKCAYFLHQA